jgi:hypothetical protein
MEHHAENWQKLPESLDKRLKKFADDINPPMPDNGLRSAISAAAETFGRQICKIVGDHLDAKLTVNEYEGSRLDKRDVDKAKLVAEKYLTTRLGRRMDADRKRSMLERAVKKIGTDHQQPATTNDDDFILPARQVRTQRTEAAATSVKRPLPSPSPVIENTCSDSNRFSVLDNLIDDDSSPPEPSPTIRREAKKPRIAFTSEENTQLDGVKKTPTGVFVHEGPKHAWTLEPSERTKVLVIGDSNLRNANGAEVPEDWEIHCFPGGRFKHVAAVTRDMPIPPVLERVIVQVGINHRDEHKDVTSQEIGLMERALGRIADKVSVVGISVSNSLDSAAKLTVRRINQSLAYAFPIFIKPLKEDEVVISITDDHGIHHDGATVTRIMSSIVQHVQSLN